MERDGVCAQKIMRALPRSFYARGTVDVARDLLGKVLVHGPTAGIIVETEAYLGGDDLASHSAAGITDRTWVIFGPGGHAYVYLSYGMHDCMNIVAEKAGAPGCVLIRALEPIDGLDVMRARRPKARMDRDLASGPGKLTRALGITREHTGLDMTRGDLIVVAPPAATPFEIVVTPRVGITKCADLPLRFIMKGNRFVSRSNIGGWQEKSG
jgi:DNA-3-methyladenine glycosylase